MKPYCHWFLVGIRHWANYGAFHMQNQFTSLEVNKTMCLAFPFRVLSGKQPIMRSSHHVSKGTHSSATLHCQTSVKSDEWLI